MVTDSESCNVFPQINHRPYVMMDDCSKRDLFHNVHGVLDIMDPFKCLHEIITLL